MIIKTTNAAKMFRSLHHAHPFRSSSLCFFLLRCWPPFILLLASSALTLPSFLVLPSIQQSGKKLDGKEETGNGKLNKKRTKRKINANLNIGRAFAGPHSSRGRTLLHGIISNRPRWPVWLLVFLSFRVFLLGWLC